MFGQSKQDVEAQVFADSFYNRGYLRKLVPRYDKELKNLESAKYAELTDGLFWYQVFGSSTTERSFRFVEGGTFAEGLGTFGQSLTDAPKSFSGSLQLCILSTSSVPTHVYGWLTRLLAANPRRINQIVSFPRYAVAIEIEKVWGPLSECSYRSIERPEQITAVEQLSLPEFREQFQCHTALECNCKRYDVPEITNHYDKRPPPTKYGGKIPQEKYTTGRPQFSLCLPSQDIGHNRSPTDEALTTQCSRIFLRDTSSFTFTWQRGAPIYHGGFDTFLWERYSKPPSCDYAEIFYQDDRGTTQPRRVLMTLSTTPTWVDVSPLLGSIKYLLGESGVVSSFMQKLPTDQENHLYALLPLFVIFEQIIDDTVIFLQQAFDQTKKISFAGRGGASVEKIHYLCHLNDCRESAVLGLAHVHSVMVDLLSIIRSGASEDSSTVLQFLQEKEKDLAYLIQRLEKFERIVEDQSLLIKSHRQLAQARQMSTLTYIATIWVPLSFVTGLVGMQVTDPTLLFHHSKNTRSSSVTNGSATNTSILARQVSASPSFTTGTATAAILGLLSSQLAQESQIANSSATIAIAANAPGPYVWPFGFFVGLAGALFVTSLLLPLVGPNLLRIAVQRSYTIRNYYIFWPFVFALYYISVYWMVPEIMVAALRCHGSFCTDEENDYYSGTSDYFFIYDFKTSGDSAINTVTYVLSAVVMGAIGLTQLAMAVMYRKGALVTITWLGFAAVVIVVYFIDYYGSVEESYSYPISTGLSVSAILPLVYLLVVWSTPQLWGLSKRYFKTHAKVKTV